MTLAAVDPMVWLVGFVVVVTLVVLVIAALVKYLRS